MADNSDSARKRLVQDRSGYVWNYTSGILRFEWKMTTNSEKYAEEKMHIHAHTFTCASIFIQIKCKERFDIPGYIQIP